MTYDRTTVTLRSIDVGFDLRLHKMTAQIPAGTTHVLCDERQRGACVLARREPVTGTPEEITQQLRGFGYRVRWTEAR